MDCESVIYLQNFKRLEMHHTGLSCQADNEAEVFATQVIFMHRDAPFEAVFCC